MDKKRFGTYGLPEATLSRAMALYPRVELMANPSRGLNVPTIAVAPICALIACEETGSNKVTERVAQAVSCLAPAEFSKALRNVRGSLAEVERKSKTNATGPSPQKQNVNDTLVKKAATVAKPPPARPEINRNPSLRNKPSVSETSTRPVKVHSFDGMCKRYGFDPAGLVGSLDQVYSHLSEQGWDPKKWKQNESPIKCAVFYWVCRLQGRKLRDLPIFCEELSVTLRLVQSVIKSMETIRDHLVPLATAQPNNSLAAPSGSVSPTSSSLKRKAAVSSADSESLASEPGPSSKRIRTESVHSDPGSSEGEDIHVLPTHSVQSVSRASEDVDGDSLQGTGLSSGLSHHSTPEKPSMMDLAPTEITPRKRNHLPTKSTPRVDSPTKSGRKKIQQDESLMELEEQPNLPRYRPVLADRTFYTSSKDDSIMIDEESWIRWLEDKRKALLA